ncbi:MAG TPA: ATP-dependent Clp protease ATP-binding subunit [Solibacterales bacterium]|nr:ATP-dependent Clp protease ATP-binding subunit [Bryobacterales bacterium]
MRSTPVTIRTRTAPEPSDLAAQLASRVVGQPAAVESIVPYVTMYQAGLSPEGRPVGVFLLLGPTGTGKTRTVEALAESLHGTSRHVLRVDCGEFQMEHEVAKLIGAPPGYLGHRETHPLLTQAKLNAVTSDRSSLSIVLFDEIEKAAASLTRLLLGVLDRATLRLGDNTTVNFEGSLIFLTSNLGAREMFRELNRGFGFGGMLPPEAGASQRLEAIAMSAVRRRFSPEFVNRIDASITYYPLTDASLEAILDLHLEQLQSHIVSRLGPRAFRIELTQEARRFLLERGASREFGARQLKRIIHKHLTQPLAALVAAGRVEPTSRVKADAGPEALKFTCRRAELAA